MVARALARLALLASGCLYAVPADDGLGGRWWLAERRGTADPVGITRRDRLGFIAFAFERYYQHYVLGLLESRSCVGWHWFKYHDDPKESTNLDSAGGVNKGMFTIDLEPHQLLWDAAGAVNREAYPLTEFFDGRR